ncbi:MAG TPA: hypothetical protein VIC26_08565 [Marinagarivorans sp.]
MINARYIISAALLKSVAARFKNDQDLDAAHSMDNTKREALELLPIIAGAGVTKDSQQTTRTLIRMGAFFFGGMAAGMMTSNAPRKMLFLARQLNGVA